MKLYYYPASTTSRPVMLFAADTGIPLEYEMVDLMAGENTQPAFTRINPSQQVPVLEDGNFRLTECSAILRYLADRYDSVAYPKDLQERARVNECMDWFNTGFCRDVAYGVYYPQIFPNHRRPTSEAQAAHLAWGREKASRWLTILDRHILGPNTYLCGDSITLADYLAIAMLTLGEVTRQDYRRWENVSRWIVTMKSRPHWKAVHEAFYNHLVPAYEGVAFTHVTPSAGSDV